MPSYSTADIRNVALIGHGGAGKTSLAEAILHVSGTTNRLGSVPDGTSHLDFTEEEKERGCSIDSALCHISHDGVEINIVDTPGAPDFVGPAIASLAAVETAICVISAPAGIEINTRRMMTKAAEHGLARAVVINKIDAESVNLEELLGQVRELFSDACQPLNLPTRGGEGVIDCLANDSGESDFSDLGIEHTTLVERIVEADEQLMEEYLENGDVGADKLAGTIAKAVAGGSLIPVLFTNARGEVGIRELIDAIARVMPSPVDGRRRQLRTADREEPIEPDPNQPLVAQVFKVAADPRSNIKYSAMRVHSGRLTHETGMQIGDDRRAQRPGQLHKLQGAEQTEVEEGIAGDLVVAAKLDLHIGDVLHTGTPGAIAMPSFPTPMFALAIEPKSRSDADKVSGALTRFSDEDPCFQADRDPATQELVIRGVGDLHLRTVLSRMQRHFKLDVNTKPPKIPYRETITAVAREVEYTHKKQTGGAGQYARVVITIEPKTDGEYEFVDEVRGRNVEPEFRPSVDKGIRAQMREGVMAGFPVVNVTARLTDGKTHPVDSKDIAFQIAAREAFREAFMKAKPVLLEPIVNMEVTVPAQYVGDIQGDLASRRGRPVGQDMLPGNMSVIKAQVPLAEVADYNSRLSSITGGQGSYAMDFSHYEQVPANVQQQIVEGAKRAKREER